jgi:hypothetical protein
MGNKKKKNGLVAHPDSNREYSAPNNQIKTHERMWVIKIKILAS